MKINTYGLPMRGLKKASGATFSWSGHTQISYDMETGEVLTRDLIGNNYVVYDDPSVIFICDGTRHLTMQEIADLIMQRVWERTHSGLY